MRFLPLICIVTVGNAYALEGCPGAKWTSEVPSKAPCEAAACFERKILSETGEVCGTTLDAAYDGYFTVTIFDSKGKKHVIEKYVLDPDGENISRVEVSDANGQLLYYSVGEGSPLLPNGEPIEESSPNPAGRFYEEAVQLLYEEKP